MTIEVTQPAAAEDEVERVAREQEAYRAGYRTAMEMARASAPPELVDRLLALKRASPSIYGPLFDQTCAAIAALHGAGMVLVPREPTEAMAEAAAVAYRAAREAAVDRRYKSTANHEYAAANFVADWLAPVWSAMIAACAKQGGE